MIEIQHLTQVSVSGAFEKKTELLKISMYNALHDQKYSIET